MSTYLFVADQWEKVLRASEGHASLLLSPWEEEKVFSLCAPGTEQVVLYLHANMGDAEERRHAPETARRILSYAETHGLRAQVVVYSADLVYAFGVISEVAEHAPGAEGACRAAPKSDLDRADTTFDGLVTLAMGSHFTSQHALALTHIENAVLFAELERAELPSIDVSACPSMGGDVRRWIADAGAALSRRQGSKQSVLSKRLGCSWDELLGAIRGNDELDAVPAVQCLFGPLPAAYQLAPRRERTSWLTDNVTPRTDGQKLRAKMVLLHGPDLERTAHLLAIAIPTAIEASYHLDMSYGVVDAGDTSGLSSAWDRQGHDVELILCRADLQSKESVDRILALEADEEIVPVLVVLWGSWMLPVSKVLSLLRPAVAPRPFAVYIVGAPGMTGVVQEPLWRTLQNAKLLGHTRVVCSPFRALPLPGGVSEAFPLPITRCVTADEYMATTEASARNTLALAYHSWGTSTRRLYEEVCGGTPGLWQETTRLLGEWERQEEGEATTRIARLFRESRALYERMTSPDQEQLDVPGIEDRRPPVWRAVFVDHDRAEIVLFVVPSGLCPTFPGVDQL